MSIRNQSTYLTELRQHLSRLPEAEREDILRDQEEFFREALLSGRTEADVIGSLGDPKQLAKTLIAESRISASENALGVTLASGATNEGSAPLPNASFTAQMNATLRAFLAILTLAPFNLIFVLGPFIGVMACLFAGWAAGGALLITGFASLVFVLSELVGLGPASGWAHVSSATLGLGIVFCSIAFLGVMVLVTSWVAQASVRYLRWNLDLIVARK